MHFVDNVMLIFFIRLKENIRVFWNMKSPISTYHIKRIITGYMVFLFFFFFKSMVFLHPFHVPQWQIHYNWVVCCSMAWCLALCVSIEREGKEDMQMTILQEYLFKVYFNWYHLHLEKLPLYNYTKFCFHNPQQCQVNLHPLHLENHTFIIKDKTY